MAACFTTRANLVCRPGIVPGCFRTALSTPPVFPFQHRHKFWSARRDSNPHGVSRCVLSAVCLPVPPRAEILEDGRRIELRVNRFAGGAVSVSLPSSIWWVEQDLNLQARPEQPGYSRLVSPITTSTQIWWTEPPQRIRMRWGPREYDSNSHAEAALFESAVYFRSTIGPNKKSRLTLRAGRPGSIYLSCRLARTSVKAQRCIAGRGN